MVITDRFDHLIDDKNRLAIPSQVRNALDPEADGEFFYIVPKARFLELIPAKLFERATQGAAGGLYTDPDEAKAKRLLFGSTARLEMDKQGRGIIPERFLAGGKNRDLMSEGFLGKEVTLMGIGDRLELWNRADLQAHLRELIADRANVERGGSRMFAGAAPTPGGATN